MGRSIEPFPGSAVPAFWSQAADPTRTLRPLARSELWPLFVQTPFPGRLSEGTGNPPSEGQLPLRKIEAPRNGIDLDINPDLLPFLPLPPPSSSSPLAGHATPSSRRKPSPSRIPLAGHQTRSLKPLQTSNLPHPPQQPACLPPQGLQPTSTAFTPAPTVSTSTLLP